MTLYHGSSFGGLTELCCALLSAASAVAEASVTALLAVCFSSMVFYSPHYEVPNNSSAISAFSIRMMLSSEAP